ncbi:MAG TPA: hypothetical protein VFE20_08050 [Thermoleophilia bacterium]|nr:hypothetical protein [Thermoleophilia bacterium]
MGRRGATRYLEIVLGAFLAVLGAAFLLSNVFDLDLSSQLWPLWVLVPGLVLLTLAFSVRLLAGLAVPGSVIAMAGLILLVLNATGQWQAWAYAWTLVAPTSAGAGLMIYGRLSGRPASYRVGLSLVLVGLVLFLLLMAFFELIIGLSGYTELRFMWPLVLILAGILVLLSPYLWRRRSL